MCVRCTQHVAELLAALLTFHDFEIRLDRLKVSSSRRVRLPGFCGKLEHHTSGLDLRCIADGVEDRFLKLMTSSPDR